MRSPMTFRMPSSSSGLRVGLAGAMPCPAVASFPSEPVVGGTGAKCAVSRNVSPGANGGEAGVGGGWAAVWATVVACACGTGVRSASPGGSGNTDGVGSGVDDGSTEAETGGVGTWGAEGGASGHAEGRAVISVPTSAVTAAPWRVTLVSRSLCLRS